MTINDNHEMEEIIMAKKRSIKVYGQSGYKYQETPTIMLKGMWLKELGFDIDYTSVTCEDGRLVITPDAERAAVKAAEAEYMEREMKALRKRYEAEKVKFGLRWWRSRERGGKHVYHGRVAGNRPEVFYGDRCGCL